MRFDYWVGRLFCLFGLHTFSVSEVSYNFETREISSHCKYCQKVIHTIKHETDLTDEQYYWFKKIFENF
ncbi:hypothetical protein LCGC14_2173550 [marine sediment metagenome]|uniref:Uncharacterized protein n=1 Tax=marine sediment metagenome TaxID=412755 RepID=A0A0F9G212_9ZZZZ